MQTRNISTRTLQIHLDNNSRYYWWQYNFVWISPKQKFLFGYFIHKRFNISCSGKCISLFVFFCYASALAVVLSTVWIGPQTYSYRVFLSRWWHDANKTKKKKAFGWSWAAHNSRKNQRTNQFKALSFQTKSHTHTPSAYLSVTLK